MLSLSMMCWTYQRFEAGRMGHCILKKNLRISQMITKWYYTSSTIIERLVSPMSRQCPRAKEHGVMRSDITKSADLNQTCLATRAMSNSRSTHNLSGVERISNGRRSRLDPTGSVASHQSPDYGALGSSGEQKDKCDLPRYQSLYT